MDQTTGIKNRVIGGVVILAFCGGLFWIFTIYQKIEKVRQEKNFIKEKEFNERLAVERGKIEEDLEEKYRADRVSYEAMARRLEMEKQRARELQEKLKTVPRTKKP